MCLRILSWLLQMGLYVYMYVHDCCFCCCRILQWTGCLCKKTLGTGAAGLVHIVWNELGPDATRYTINNTQFTVNHWLLQVRLLLLLLLATWSIWFALVLAASFLCWWLLLSSWLLLVPQTLHSRCKM
jgi:hypothetical protein